jgi:hypothetical protein
VLFYDKNKIRKIKQFSAKKRKNNHDFYHFQTVTHLANHHLCVENLKIIRALKYLPLKCIENGMLQRSFAIDCKIKYSAP